MLVTHPIQSFPNPDPTPENPMTQTLSRCAQTLLLAAASTAALAHGQIKCEAIPKAEWKPQTELQKQLVGEGWRVRKVKIENGCYEVYGFDAKGTRVEAFFNPKTFERVEAGK
jgi:hypothetical protein